MASQKTPPPWRSPMVGSYGEQWGEGAARCFSIESDWDEDESVRLMPIPDCFICPMSQTPMEDPVMTVDGCVYERVYIEQWIRHRQQQVMYVSSPATNRELPSNKLVSLQALKHAIETYLAHRPELRGSLTASRSFEEAAQMLQSDLFEKQAAHVRVEDELSLLRDSNEALVGALEDTERSNMALRQSARESEQAQESLRKELQELRRSAPHAAAGDGPVCGRRKAGPAYYVWLVFGIGLLGWLFASSGGCWAWSTGAAASEGSPAPARSAGEGSLGTLVGASLEEAVHSQQGQPASRRRGSSEGGRSDFRKSGGLPPPEGGEEAAVRPVGGAARNETTGNDSMLSSDAEVAADAGGNETTLGSGGWIAELRSGGGIAQGISCAAGHDDVRLMQQVALLRAGTQTEKTEAALVLSILATTGPENQACIVRTGAVAQLVHLLRGDSPEARGQAAVALRALASNSTYNKVAIVRAGAIQPLIQILKQDEVDVQEVAAGALETLAETNNQVEIVQAGAIVQLVAMLNDERPKAREEAAGALVVLSTNVDNRAAIAQVGAIPILVELLTDSVAEVRVQAAAALRNLATEDAEGQITSALAGAAEGQ